MSPSRSRKFTQSLKQTAVYWGGPTNTVDGDRTFDAAVELAVRWEVRHELFNDQYGQEQRSNAIVYLAQDVDLGGYLFLGDLDDLDSAQEGDPMTVKAAREVRGLDKSPDYRGTGYMRKVYL